MPGLDESASTGLWPVPEELSRRAGRNLPAIRAYYFLQDCANSGREFTIEDLYAATGWTGDTPRTYITKQWRQFLEKSSSGKFSVNRRFLRLSLRDYLKNFSQVKLLLGEYDRAVHQNVVSYEFLLPLTRERELRESLDQLFFLDTVSGRIREIGVDKIARVIDRGAQEAEEDYIGRVCGMVAQYFGGYSIVHVQGRFRASESLVTREHAGRILGEGGRYLIDETTASVRFIVPLRVSVRVFDEDFGSVSEVVEQPEDRLLAITDLQEEVRLVRNLFFAFFVEAVVDTIQGEDEIWLIESSPHGQRLFKWMSRMAS